MKHTLALLAALLTAAPAFAQITIDQNKALAGNVTPGDGPGFPVTLSQPGSYKLTGNLSVPANTKGIVIAAEGVTLDLNGYTIAAPGLCSQPFNYTAQPVTCTQPTYGTYHGIEVAVDAPGTVIRNGTVRGFSGTGIQTTEGETIEHMHVAHNGNGGIGGSTGSMVGTRIIDSTIALNYRFGIAESSGIVERCNVASNGGDGVTGGGFLIVRNSNVRANYGNSLSGVTVVGTMSANNRYGRLKVTSLGGNIEQLVVY